MEPVGDRLPKGARLGPHSQSCVYQGKGEDSSDNDVSRKEGALLKVTYEQEVGVPMYEISDEPIDHADEMDSVIVHFTKAGRPVLLEILDSSKFLSKTIQATEKAR